jgi:hypothetical protein
MNNELHARKVRTLRCLGMDVADALVDSIASPIVSSALHARDASDAGKIETAAMWR